MSKSSSSTEHSGGGIGDLPEYFRESVEEIKKVSTPTRQETIQATVVTLVLLVVVSLCLVLLDVIFGQLMSAIVG